MQSLAGPFLSDINERAFLVSPQAVALDSTLRDDSMNAGAVLGREGPQSFTPQRKADDQDRDEFEQGGLF